MRGADTGGGMSKHVITVDECILEPFTHVLASSSSKGSSKRLTVTIDLNRASTVYTVTDHDETRYTGHYIQEAVAAYNRAP